MPLPLILSIPHGAAKIPAHIRSEMALTDRQIVESVDFGSREIFAGLEALHIIEAHWSRLVVDLNRNPADFGPKGVVALYDYHGRSVFKPGKAPSTAEIERRVEHFSRPYHEALEKALGSEGAMGLIDCHSLNGVGPSDAPDRGMLRKDITLSNNGDRHGRPRPEEAATTCSAETIHSLAAAFREQGFSVSINHPYRGGYIVNHYGALLRRRGGFALQIEMNQDLYMARNAIVTDAERLKAVTVRVEKALGQWSLSLLQSVA